MDAPPGFEESFGTKVCKLRKSLYGLKQFLRAWFERFTRPVKNHDYNQEQTNHTMFMKHTRGGKIAILIVYVEDIILTRSDEAEIARLKKCLAAKFEIKDLRSLQYFLGIGNRCHTKKVRCGPSEETEMSDKKHLEAVYRILRYLKSTSEIGILFKKSE